MENHSVIEATSDEVVINPQEAAANRRGPRVYPKERGCDISPERAIPRCVRLQVARKRRQVDLGVCTLHVGQRLAEAFADDLKLHGWHIAQANLATNQLTFPLREDLKTGAPLTFGMCFSVYAQTAGTKSAEGNVTKARRLLGEIFSIPRPENQWDEGYAFWRARVDAIPVNELKAINVAKWRKLNIVDSPREGLSKETLKGWLRALVSVFCEELRPIYGEMGLTGALPGEGVKVPQPRMNRFFCSMCPQSLLDRARQDLRRRHPQAYLIFLLAYVMGLRRREAEELKWSGVDFAAGVLHVSPSHSGEERLKTESSECQLELPPALSSLLAQYYQDRTGDYVIESNLVSKRNASGRSSYRARQHSQFLIAWLKSIGFVYRSPIHALRKFRGMLIARDHGIEEASLCLRHSSTRVTRQAYVGAVVSSRFAETI